MSQSVRATHAFGLYCFLIAIYLSVGGFFQFRFGLWGIAFNEIGLLLLPALLYSKATGLNFKKTFPLKRISFYELLFILLMTAVVLLPIELMTRLQQHYWPLPDSIAQFYENLSERKVWWDGLRQVVILALIPAVCEEFFFRGLLQSLMVSHFGSWKGVVLTSLLFAVAHLNPWYLPYYILLGCYLGWLREWKANLAFCIIAHFANNAYSLF